MVNNSREAYSIIKEAATGIFPGCRIMLFGSRARKDFSENSDYDFLVITKEEVDTRQKRILKSQLRKELARKKIPADVLVESEAEVRAKRTVTGHIIREIITEGVDL